MVVKDAQPNDAQDFAFTAGGGLSPASFSLDDDSDADALEHAHLQQRPGRLGGYSLAETVPRGWEQSSATCNDGSPVSNINVAAGETVTCTFTNQKRGSITVVKDATPDDPQDFTSRPAAASARRASRSTTTPTARCRTRAPSRTWRPGSATRSSETVPSGWDQTGATCDDGSPVSNINVAPAENVTCTFTNRKRGQIVVVEGRHARRRPGLQLHRRRRPQPGELLARRRRRTRRSRTRARSRTSCPARATRSSETVPGGWDQTGATCDDGSPVVEHRRRRRRDRDLHVHEPQARARSWSSRTRSPNDPQDFAFTAGGGLSPASFSLDDDSDGTLSNTRTFANVVPGVGYSLSRDRARRLGPDRRDLRRRQPALEHRLSRGRDRHLHVHEPQARPDRRGQGRAARTTPRTSPSPPAAASAPRASRSTTTPTRRSRTRARSRTSCRASGYSLSETVPERLGPDRAPPVTTAARVSNIDVSAGETVTCTFTNDRRGQITVVKNATPDDAAGLPFTAGGGLSPASFSLDDDLDPTLSNTQHVQRRAGRLRLLGRRDRARAAGTRRARPATTAARSRTSTSSAGEHVTCTFTNDKRGTIVVVEDSTPNDPQDFSFTAGGGLSPASFQLDDDSEPDAVEHADVRRRGARRRLLARPRPCRAAGTRSARPATTAARSRT